MPTKYAVLLIAPLLAACQAALSMGGLDIAKVQAAISSELNTSYASISRVVSSVDCPAVPDKPAAGDTFVCNADVDSQRVRVEVTVADADYNVNFTTLDVLFDLPRTAAGLADAVSAHYDFAVEVTCGDGLRVVEVHQTLDCTATDPLGNTRTVRVTAGAPGEDDEWEIIE